MTAVSLASLPFLTLAVLAVLLLAVLRGQVRQFVFLSVNLVILSSLFLGPAGALSIVAYCILGFLLTLLVRRWERFGLVVAIVAYVVLFVYMRRYDFLGWFLPASFLTTIFRVAGLSFLFFKVVHVMVDARSETLGRLDFLTYLNYCLNFTTFLMGPIQRYQDYADQWEGRKPAIPPTFEAHLDAVLRIVAGLVKAYILAAWFQTRALAPGTDILELSLVGLLVHVYAFYFYLYLNFSGYCDVAIGLGSLFGVRPPENFNKPFLARNISDFWLRQHRSLTLWLTDYVFSPSFKKSLSSDSVLSRHPLLAANACLMLTLLVSGLWHGTTISFLLFGLVHGLFFVIYRTWTALMTSWLGKKRLRRLRSTWVAQAAGIILTFNATAFAFIFFQLRPDTLLRTVASL